MKLVALYPQSTRILQSIQQEEKVYGYLDLMRGHHEETYYHLVRVGLLSIDLGIQNFLPDDQLRLLGNTGILHDVGKTEISTCILGKEGPLNDGERRIMQSHPRLGFLKLDDFDEPVKRVVVAHHEYQPSPYPRQGDDRRRTPRETSDRRQTDGTILTLAQILAAADVFDALSCPRAYKEALPLGQVAQLMNDHYQGSRVFLQQVLQRQYVH